MSREANRPPKRPLDSFREDELWRKINAAHAKKKDKDEAMQGETDELLLKESGKKLFEEDRAVDLDLSLEEKDDKIRDFVHALYRGDELSEQRKTGPLRQPVAVQDESKSNDEGGSEEQREEPAIRRPHVRRPSLDSARFVDKTSVVCDETKPEDQETTERVQTSGIRSIHLIPAVEETIQDDTEEVLQQPEPEEEKLESFAPAPELFLSEDLLVEQKDETAEVSLDEKTSEDEAKDPLTHPLFSDLKEEEELPEILKRDPDATPIRAPQPAFVEGSKNLVTNEEKQKREKAKEEFEASLKPLKQQAIDQTVSKLQSGALAPPFYVPRLPRQASSFDEAMDFARRLHPLPQEMQLKQKPTHRTWMLAQLNHCNTQERLSRFAFSLNYEDLALLFPTLASLKRGKHIERLLSIILMRASHYLYLQGWITLQYSYPRSTVEKGLSELCSILEDSFFKGGPELGQAERECLTRLNFGDQQFIWPKIRLISEIAYPNQRHFISKIISAVQEEGKALEDFYREFAVYRDLPLAKAIQSQWDMSLIEKRQSTAYSPRQYFTE